MDAAAGETTIEPARRRERSGRTARREQRSHGSEGLGRPYIVRNIPTYDILSEENLVRIEQTADRILAEIGIEFRDDPAALAHWKRAGATISRRAGQVRAGHAARDPEDRAGAVHPACAQPRKVGGDRRQERRLLSGLWLALRHGSRQWPPLRHDRGFPELREARAVVALAAPFRRHDLRAGRRAGQQAPSRHGLFAHQIFRSRLHGLGHGGEPGRGFDRHGAHPVRRANSSTATASSSATSTSTRRWSGTPP